MFRYGLSALWFSGVARALAPLTAGKGAILMMHRVQPGHVHGPFAPNAALSITPEYLGSLLAAFRTSGLDVVDLDEAMRRVESQDATQPFVCFTFDDGYRDNLQHAMPVFQRYQCPFTVYATSSFVERSFDPWWVLLERVVATHARIRWADAAGDTNYDTAELDAKYEVFAALSQRLMQLPLAALREQMARLAHDHGLAVGEVSERETCDYSELLQLRAGGAEIGCHTVSHALLLRETDAVVREELSTARTSLEAGLRCPVRHLAFPYGKRDHVGDRDIALAAELGFATATTTRKGALFTAHAVHRHALPRVEVTSSFERSPHYLQAILSGLPLLLYNRGQLAVTD